MSAQRLTRRLPNAINYLFLGSVAFLSVFPFVWMVISATNKNVDILKGRLSIGSSLMENINAFLAAVDLPLVMWNSLKIALIGTAVTMLVSSMAGYGFEMFRSKWRDRLYTAMLLTLFVPFAALMIPLYMMMGKAGLIDTHVAIVLPTIASAFIIFYFRQASKAFPAELRDAAKVDGLKEWQIFLYIYVPVMRSTYAAAFVIVALTYVVALGEFPHVIAGSTEAAYALLRGEAGVSDYLLRFLAPTLLGNIVGGTALAALLNHAPIAHDFAAQKEAAG